MAPVCPLGGKDTNALAEAETGAAVCFTERQRGCLSLAAGQVCQHRAENSAVAGKNLAVRAHSQTIAQEN